MNRPSRLSPWLALLATALPMAHAASTDIADVPMAVTTRAAPNIMFVLDDSGSMQWELLPDEVTWVPYVFPRLVSGVYGGSDYSNIVPTRRPPGLSSA
jgi:type IV pilus assembly protein PilY1